MSEVSAHRRPLATAAAAAGVLVALWFVPSANASPDAAAPAGSATSTTAQDDSAAVHDAAAGHGTLPRLRESDDFDGTPYVVGGLALAGASGVLALRAARRG